MSAAQALKAARAAGIELGIDGDDLLWAAPEQPPAAVLDLLARHKTGLVALLQSSGDGWSVDDWQNFFKERANIAEHNGFPRLDAEMSAFDDCVDHWLTMHPPLANRHEGCLRCGISVSSKEGSSVTVACSDGIAGWLHADCAPTWQNLRRWDAPTALMWLSDRTRKAAR